MGKITEITENNKTKGQRVKVYCSQCNSLTNHEVIQSVDVEGSEVIFDDYGTIDWTDNYQVIKCQGCDLITFRHLNWFSENRQQIGEDEWDDGYTEYLYPKRSIDVRVEKEFSNLPWLLGRIYHETVDCYNNKSRILCAAGLRAIIEGICLEQKVKDGPLLKDDKITPILKKDGITPVRSESLKGKIMGLHEKGILTKASADMLHEHRFLGNDAIHDFQVPTMVVLALAMDIIEHVLEDLYEIPDKAEELRQERTKKI